MTKQFMMTAKEAACGRGVYTARGIAAEADLIGTLVGMDFWQVTNNGADGLDRTVTVSDRFGGPLAVLTPRLTVDGSPLPFATLTEAGDSEGLCEAAYEKFLTRRIEASRLARRAD